MAELDLAALNALPKSGQALALAVVNGQLEQLSAQERVAWALEHLPGSLCFPPALVFRRRCACIWSRASSRISR